MLASLAEGCGLLLTKSALEASLNPIWRTIKSVAGTIRYEIVQWHPFFRVTETVQVVFPFATVGVI